MELFVTFVSEQWILVSVLVVLIYAYAWTEKQKGGTTISHHQLTRLVNSDSAVVVDVRDAAEYKAGHIVDALNIPHASLSSRSRELDTHKGKTIVLVDKMGQHAGAAGRQLKALDFDIVRLEGGMTDWQSNNLPVVK